MMTERVKYDDVPSARKKGVIPYGTLLKRDCGRKKKRGIKAHMHKVNAYCPKMNGHPLKSINGNDYEPTKLLRVGVGGGRLQAF